MIWRGPPDEWLSWSLAAQAKMTLGQDPGPRQGRGQGGSLGPRCWEPDPWAQSGAQHGVQAACRPHCLGQHRRSPCGAGAAQPAGKATAHPPSLTGSSGDAESGFPKESGSETGERLVGGRTRVGFRLYPHGGNVRAAATVRMAHCASGCQPDVTLKVRAAVRHLEPDAVKEASSPEAKAQPEGSPPPPRVALPSKH